MIRRPARKNIEEMREVAARICRDYLTGAWKSISAEDIQIKRISGGLSNFLYHVSLPSNLLQCNNNNDPKPKNSKRQRKDSLNNVLPEPKEVLLRLYGQIHGEQALETVLTDTVVFTLLSERKLGPKLHGIFPGGRIEQYIPARCLISSELSDPRISSKIAEKMAEIHTLNIPVSKEPEWLWNTMYRWLLNAEQILKYFKTTDVTIKHHVTYIQKIDYRKEVEWLKMEIENNNDFPVVFSHNDLQEGNILFKQHFAKDFAMEQLSSEFEDSTVLVNDAAVPPDSVCDNANDIVPINYRSRKRSLSDHDNDCSFDMSSDSVISNISDLGFTDKCDTTEPELMIIDYEYCAYNYRGFDIANHFIEWTLDYTNCSFPFYFHKKEQYPTDEQQRLFISAYLNKLNATEPKDDSDVDDVLNEVRCLTLACHLFWSLWSLVNVSQDIEFGYWTYADCRTKEYFEAKDQYIKWKDVNLKRQHVLDDRK